MGRRSVHQFFSSCYIDISLPSSTARQLSYLRTKKKTYRVVKVVLLRRLLLVPLDNTELGLILGILHHMPVECLSSAAPSSLNGATYLLILSVDTSSFDQFRLELLGSVLAVSYCLVIEQESLTGLDWRCTTIV
jgi:hypothetical protein